MLPTIFYPSFLLFSSREFQLHGNIGHGHVGENLVPRNGSIGLIVGLVHGDGFGKAYRRMPLDQVAVSQSLADFFRPCLYCHFLHNSSAGRRLLGLGKAQDVVFLVIGFVFSQDNSRTAATRFHRHVVQTDRIQGSGCRVVFEDETEGALDEQETRLGILRGSATKATTTNGHSTAMDVPIGFKVGTCSSSQVVHGSTAFTTGSVSQEGEQRRISPAIGFA
jgi:hypothetical protein